MEEKEGTKNKYKDENKLRRRRRKRIKTSHGTARLAL